MASHDINEHKAYEEFAQEIYQTLLDSQDIKPTKVQYDVKIVGRSGCKHHIDVYWEYDISGVTYRVAIQCKFYKSTNITIEYIREFFAILTDIGGINGIFVCTKGYKSSSRKFADFYGIKLKELSVPVDSDWERNIQKTKIDLSDLLVIIKKRKPEFDRDWFEANFNNLAEDESYEINGRTTKEIWIKDKDGNRITDLQELEHGLPREWKNNHFIKHEYKWEDAYIDVERLGDVKLLSLKYVYKMQMPEPDETIISGKEIAKGILNDVKSDSFKFVETK